MEIGARQPPRRYQYRDELHEEDLQNAFRKIERFIALAEREASLRDEFSGRERALSARLPI